MLFSIIHSSVWRQEESAGCCYRKNKKEAYNIGDLLDPTPSISVARYYKSVLGKIETNRKKKDPSKCTQCFTTVPKIITG